MSSLRKIPLCSVYLLPGILASPTMLELQPQDLLYKNRSHVSLGQNSKMSQPWGFLSKWIEHRGQAGIFSLS